MKKLIFVTVTVALAMLISPSGPGAVVRSRPLPAFTDARAERLEHFAAHVVVRPARRIHKPPPPTPSPPPTPTPTPTLDPIDPYGPSNEIPFCKTEDPPDPDPCYPAPPQVLESPVPTSTPTVS